MDQTIYPIRTREETPDGHILRLDYGPKLGTTVIRVHNSPDPDAETNLRTRIDRVLRDYGWRLLPASAPTNGATEGA